MIKGNWLYEIYKHIRQRIAIEFHAIDQEDGNRVILQEDSKIYIENNDPSDIEIARTAHSEARTVLDHQINTLNDIDDKALSTVRITIVLTGAIIGVASFGGGDDIALNNPYIIWGSVNLILSILIGIITYSVTEPYTGTSPNDLETLLNNTEDELDMLSFLVKEGYKEWIEEAANLNSTNAKILELTQFALATGLVFWSLGVAHQIIEEDSSMHNFLALITEVSFSAIPLLGVPSIAIILILSFRLLGK